MTPEYTARHAHVDTSRVGSDPACSGDQVAEQLEHPNRSMVTLDLSTPTQVNYLVTNFYREVVFDELLEPVFGEVAEVDWAEHIPRLIDYWCWILFATDPYPGAVTRTHKHLHALKAIESAHCDRWFELWVHCVDERWAGPHADHAKRHAQTLMAGMAKRIFGFEWAPAVSSQPRVQRERSLR